MYSIPRSLRLKNPNHQGFCLGIFQLLPLEDALFFLCPWFCPGGCIHGYVF